jgi:hypothetical protein
MSKTMLALLIAALLAALCVALFQRTCPSPAQAALARADRTWRTNEQEAAREYMAIVLDGHVEHLLPSEQVRVYSRIVDALAESQPLLALEYARRARSRIGGVLSVETLDAARVLDEERRIAEAARREADANWAAYGERLHQERARQP